MPRALLSADPAFLALQQSPAVAGLLRLREQWLGQGVLSPGRFLFHPAGDVFLVRWAGPHRLRHYRWLALPLAPLSPVGTDVPPLHLDRPFSTPPSWHALLSAGGARSVAILCASWRRTACSRS